MIPRRLEPIRRRRYATIVYNVFAIVAVAVVALDASKVFSISPNAERYLRGAATVLGAILVSDKIDIIRDRNRQRRRKR